MGRKNVLLFIVVLCLMICSFSTVRADSGSVSLSMDTWFGKTAEEAETYLESLGYKGSADNKTGLFKDTAWEFSNDSMTPYSVAVWFEESRQINYVVFKYIASEQLVNSFYQSFSMIYGEPQHIEYKEERSGGYISITPEMLIWEGNGIQYRMGCGPKSDSTTGTIEDVIKGEAGFTVSILKLSEEVANTAEPTDTPKPTATPKPVNVEISVESVNIKDTRYGTREFYIRFKNNSSETVDRIDFYVKGYNRYGELIDSYGATIFGFYTDEVIKPGKITPKDYYYSSYQLNEATKIQIAIVKYHFVNGRTIEVPEYQYRWSTYEMN